MTKRQKYHEAGKHCSEVAGFNALKRIFGNFLSLTLILSPGRGKGCFVAINSIWPKLILKL